MIQIIPGTKHAYAWNGSYRRFTQGLRLHDILPKLTQARPKASPNPEMGQLNPGQTQVSFVHNTEI